MIAAWILQGSLAVAFFIAGGMKLGKTREELLAQGASMAWVEDFSQARVRAIGTLEVLGAVGVIVPTLVGMLSIVAPIAAGGLALTMVGAGVTHLRRGEYSAIVPPVILGAMALAVVVLRI